LIKLTQRHARDISAAWRF